MRSQREQQLTDAFCVVLCSDEVEHGVSPLTVGVFMSSRPPLTCSEDKAYDQLCQMLALQSTGQTGTDDGPAKEVPWPTSRSRALHVEKRFH
jgi:hypothetical protein